MAYNTDIMQFLIDCNFFKLINLGPGIRAVYEISYEMRYVFARSSNFSDLENFTYTEKCMVSDDGLNVHGTN